VGHAISDWLGFESYTYTTLQYMSVTSPNKHYKPYTIYDTYDIEN